MHLFRDTSLDDDLIVPSKSSNDASLRVSTIDELLVSATVPVKVRCFSDNPCEKDRGSNPEEPAPAKAALPFSAGANRQILLSCMECGVYVMVLSLVFNK